MKSNLVARTGLASIAIAALLGSAQLMAVENCYPVKGKILNSLHNPGLGSDADGLGGVTTVGVVAFNGGDQFGQLKCALVGVVTKINSPPSLSDFTHTISCDDSVASSGVAGGIVHSQLTFASTGHFTGPFDVCIAPFTENSVPVKLSGIGVFSGNTGGGGLTIQGTINICTGSIDMKFTGDICKE